MYTMQTPVLITGVNESKAAIAREILNSQSFQFQERNIKTLYGVVIRNPILIIGSSPYVGIEKIKVAVNS